MHGYENLLGVQDFFFIISRMTQRIPMYYVFVKTVCVFRNEKCCRTEKLKTIMLSGNLFLQMRREPRVTETKLEYTYNQGCKKTVKKITF